jgi:hypothetical protein
LGFKIEWEEEEEEGGGRGGRRRGIWVKVRG